jgi:hypothetical protein
MLCDVKQVNAYVSLDNELDMCGVMIVRGMEAVRKSKTKMNVSLNECQTLRKLTLHSSENVLT